jgi:AraC-like DNA-binding protein
MTGEDKGMLAGCIEKMTAQSCGTCARRDDCAFVLPEALGFLLSSVGRASRSDDRPDSPSRPFLDLLGHVARGVSRNARRRRARKTPFRNLIERELEPLLGVGPIRVEEVARALGYSRQTLYRRLKAEGATFETVFDDLRHRVALRLVRDEGLSVKEATWRLGYSDPAAFSRAFKRWTGASPRDLRGRKPH